MPVLPPPPPGWSGRSEEAVLSAEREAVRRRLRWLLLLVPFTFPMWIRIRREDPELAAKLRLELGVCVFNSVLVTVLGCCLCSMLTFRQPIVDTLTQVVLDLGLVR